MKKSKQITLSLLLACSFITNSYSQIKVDANNRVVIGGLTTDVEHKLTIRMDPNTLSGFLLDASNVANWGSSMMTSVTQPYATSYKMRYNGVDKFYVRGDGWCWGTGYSTSSDARLKTNVKNIDNALAKILKLQGVYYNYKEDNNGAPQSAKTSDNNRIGFIAQDLEKVIPEVVREDGKGFKGVAYQDLVALLAEGIKEQNAVIEQLKQEVESLKSANNELANTANNSTSVSNNKLYQNIPNPFNAKTSIKFNVDKKASTALIVIYNLKGDVVKRYDLKNNTAIPNTIEINANELEPGAYLYSLVVENTVIETRTMILTK